MQTVMGKTGVIVVEKYFDWLDYTVFGAMLLLSCLIGVYFAFFAKKKQVTSSEYLMGGRSMGIFPISMSLIASYISGISLLGLPAEMYVYGTQYWVIILSDCLVSFTMALVYLPVFYKLQITSSYEYLNQRFNRTAQLLGSGIFLLKMMLYIPMVIYVPALAFSQATGVNIHMITPLVCAVCIFYTTLGGLKAVVWTDTLQTILMMAGVVCVLVIGTIKIGGLSVVLERNQQTGRLDFLNLDLDPRIRHTFWTVVIGNYFYWLASCSVNQAMVQRCLAMPTIKQANITVLILAVGLTMLVSMCCYTGLVVFAYFHDCDPVSTKVIRKSDQLLPYFVMEIAGSVPGFPGIFMSGVFSAALSSMSTGLNSMCGVIFEDFIRPHMKEPISELKASWIMKCIVLIIGAICVAMVFIVEQLGAIVQAGKSLSSITAGPLLGMFSLGMFVPWVNSQGAIAGGALSIALTAWISIGTQTAIARGHITYPTKPISIQNCPEYLINRTYTTPSPRPYMEEPFALYRVSYMYYTLIGTIMTIVIGIVTSYITGFNDPRHLNKDLFTPIIHRFLPHDTDVKMNSLSSNNKSQCTEKQARLRKRNETEKHRRV